MAAEDWLAEEIDCDHWYVKRMCSAAARTDVVCNRCGEEGLSWGNDGRGWYLLDQDGYEHICDMERAAADDFEALE